VKLLKKQRGMTFLSLLIVLGLIAFFALLIMKVTPLYMEFNSVKNVMKTTAAMPNLGKRGKKYIRDSIDKGLYINDVATITGKDMTYEKDRKKKVWIVTADYEARTKLFANISVVAEFKHMVELPLK